MKPPNHFAPFTIHEAEFALYPADADGRTSSVSVYLGGKLEDLSPEIDYSLHRLDRHGAAFGRNVAIDESHRFTVRNLWGLWRVIPDRMPSTRRNQQYVMVVVWFDNDTTAWAKRIYFGVVSAGQRLPTDGEVVKHDAPFVAAFMIESAGLGTKPDLFPFLYGEIRYITEHETLRLYRYDFQSNAVIADDPTLLPGRAQIVQVGGQTTIEFNGEVAMKVTSAELAVRDLTAEGGTFLRSPAELTYPRLEWWLGARRLASLSATGEFAIPNFEEITEDPATDETFRMPVDGTWAAAINLNGAYANSFSEFLVDAELRYISEEEDFAIYDYSAGEFKAVSPATLATRARIVRDGARQLRIDFWDPIFGEWVAALLVALNGRVLVRSLTVEGGITPFGDPYPRLEWWMKGNQLATLTAAGELVVPELTEVAAEPVETNPYRITVNSAWAFTLGLDGAFAPHFEESMP